MFLSNDLYLAFIVDKYLIQGLIVCVFSSLILNDVVGERDNRSQRPTNIDWISVVCQAPFLDSENIKMNEARQAVT